MATRLSTHQRCQAKGVSHTRLYLERLPGFGFSDRDEVVLWVDPNTNLTTMIQITLEGHDTTKGAHVEVEYLNYTKVDGYVFPREFFERVNAPIAIDTHAWHLTGLDINRDYGLENLNGVELSGNAAAAQVLQNQMNSVYYALHDFLRPRFFSLALSYLTASTPPFHL